jgi:hypothetical protein
MGGAPPRGTKSLRCCAAVPACGGHLADWKLACEAGQADGPPELGWSGVEAYSSPQTARTVSYPRIIASRRAGPARSAR